ncbi:MAG: O-acetylhomoserine aminocarboxypropyltransferase/cysteine synthase [Ruminiclostridium sp.]|nr:O-acetylhomoserine aminocarboxypropyltransferase/cysteine synthase [Ruminiclostridium sp.]
MSNYKRGTDCLHAGYVPESGEPRNIPIVQSTTFRYGTSEAMGKLFDLEAEGYFYTRLANPTSDRVAAKICALEGGTAAMLTSSGQAASFFAIFNLCSAGDHVVSSSTIYGGTFNLFSVTMRRMGIEFTFVDPNCSEEELNAAFRPNTKAVFGESIANPALTVLDIEKFAQAAHAHGVPLIIDNTFPTPINCRPFEWGADIVIHSTTKYMDGHANQVGGAIIDSGNFDWTKYADKFPGLCTPDESYHGVTYTERFGQGGAFITKATAQLMRDFGCSPAPMNAYLLNVGLETLHLRMPQHCANALAVAQFVKDHPKVEWVTYPGLEGDANYEKAQKYMPNGTCGVVTFGVKGGRKAAETFMAGLKLASIATHVADAKTCVLHPASATHRQMSDAELEAAGVSPDLIRLSVGIEDAADIIADLEQALENV